MLLVLTVTPALYLVVERRLERRRILLEERGSAAVPVLTGTV